MIGDAVHNLRAAFDLIACSIVELGTGNRTQAQFPVFSTVQNFSKKATLPRYVGGAPENAIDTVERLQPYHGGDNQALFVIHKLDVLDKHRMIIPVGSAYRSVSLGLPKQFIEQVAAMGGSIPEGFGTHSWRPADPQFPMKDGATLLTVKAAAREDEGDKNQKFSFDVAFGEGQVVDGQPVVPTLEQLVQFSVSALKIVGDELFP